MKIIPQTKQLKRELEAAQGRDIRWEEMQKETGLALDTIRLFDDRRRCDYESLAELFVFFRDRFMQSGRQLKIEEMFVIEEEGEGFNPPTQGRPRIETYREDK